MDERTQRAFDAELRLRSLATDILEHEGCEGCQVNAAQALEFLGSFEDTIERLGIEDPRLVRERRVAEQRALVAEGRPPRLRVKLEADIVVEHPSADLEERLASAVQAALAKSLARVRGATLTGSVMTIGSPAAEDGT